MALCSTTKHRLEVEQIGDRAQVHKTPQLLEVSTTPTIRGLAATPIAPRSSSDVNLFLY